MKRLLSAWYGLENALVVGFAIALVLLQFALAAMNTRGMIKNQRNEREQLPGRASAASTLPTQAPG